MFISFLTLSSLIEEEATGFTDRQKISSVFYNRLAKGMPLQTDPTVLYALGKHKQRVLYEDLKDKLTVQYVRCERIAGGPDCKLW